MGDTPPQRGKGSRAWKDKISNVKLLFCLKLVYNILFAFATREALAGFEGEP